MWFRRADADLLLQKARWFRSQTIGNDDTLVSDRLLEIAAKLEAEAAMIEAGGVPEHEKKPAIGGWPASQLRVAPSSQ